MKTSEFFRQLSRRDWLKLASAGVIGGSVSGLLEPLARAAGPDPRRKRACILLWMNGGPSQTDTFDLKPGHANGGPFKEIQTSAPGLKISEHLPGIAKHGDKMAVIRSMNTKEGEHQRATFLMHTGYAPTGPIQYPTLGSLASKENGRDDCPLPNFVSIAPYRQFSPAAYGPGFLGPSYAPLIVGENGQFQQRAPGQPAPDYDRILKVQDIDLPKDVDPLHADSRLDILQDMQRDFVNTHPGVAPLSHLTAYERAIKLMKTAGAKAFNLEDEKEDVRDRYGRSLFGQGCLLARRLIERGVAFVEVTLAGVDNQNAGLGWDTHGQNFQQVKRLSEVLDPAWRALMDDLKERGLLDTTTIVWMGEFGRTPKINQGQGRDHFAAAWSTVIAGGGVKGGQAYGKTTAGGDEVAENPVSTQDFLATVVSALGIDPTKPNQSNVGRPIRIVDKIGNPIREVLA